MHVECECVNVHIPTCTHIHTITCNTLCHHLEGNNKDPVLQTPKLRFREFESAAGTSEREMARDRDLGKGGGGWNGELWWVFLVHHGISEHGLATVSGAGGEGAGRDLEGDQIPCL